MRETNLKNSVLNYLRTHEDVWCVKINDNFTAGIPDIIGCYRGHFFAIELKVKGGRREKLQEWTIQQIKLFGGSATFAYSLKDVKEFIRLIKINLDKQNFINII